MRLSYILLSVSRTNMVYFLIVQWFLFNKEIADLPDKIGRSLKSERIVLKTQPRRREVVKTYKIQINRFASWTNLF